MAARRELEPLQQALVDQPRAVTLGITSSPWHVLYRANEVVRATGAERRAEPRRLVGSSVLFRAAGGDDDDIGVCYNVSTRGMFLRTHAPLGAERVWIEWRVPHDKTRLRIEGKVTWRYAGETDGPRPSTPFGFGVEFVDYLGNARTLLDRAMEVLDSAGKKSFVASACRGTGLVEPLVEATRVHSTDASDRIAQIRRPKAHTLRCDDRRGASHEGR
ncbi:MAG: PilZ domain-containing protein [Polyangiaceae bacterium]